MRIAFECEVDIPDDSHLDVGSLLKSRLMVLLEWILFLHGNITNWENFNKRVIFRIFWPFI